MHDIVCFGELLWDMLPTGKVVGGAPYNICNRASALGVKASVITSIGRDPIGSELLAAVRDNSNDTSLQVLIGLIWLGRAQGRLFKRCLLWLKSAADFAIWPINTGPYNAAVEVIKTVSESILKSLEKIKCKITVRLKTNAVNPIIRPPSAANLLKSAIIPMATQKINNKYSPISKVPLIFRIE